MFSLFLPPDGRMETRIPCSVMGGCLTFLPRVSFYLLRLSQKPLRAPSFRLLHHNPAGGCFTGCFGFPLPGPAERDSERRRAHLLLRTAVLSLVLQNLRRLPLARDVSFFEHPIYSVVAFKEMKDHSPATCIFPPFLWLIADASACARALPSFRPRSVVGRPKVTSPPIREYLFFRHLFV